MMFPRRADSHARPAVAPTESANPTLHANIGSISNNMITVAARIVRAFIEVPDAALTATKPAITAARITDGSARVSNTNHASMHSTAMNRLLRRNRLSSGDNAAIRYATFCPDTAHR